MSDAQEKNSDQIAYKVHMREVEKIRREIAQNDKKYWKKLVICRSIHQRKLIFKPGDKVAIVSDHDMN